MTLAGCRAGSDDSQSEAESLLEQAQSALGDNNGDMAVKLIDSLLTNYPKEVETGRKALPLKPRAMALKAQNDISCLQSKLESSASVINNLQSQFATVGSGAGAYVIHIGVPRNWRSKTTVVPCISHKSEFLLVSTSDEPHSALKLTVNGEIRSTDTVRVAPQPPKIFFGPSVDSLGVVAQRNDGAEAATITLIGDKEKNLSLSADELHIMALTRQMADAMKTMAYGPRELKRLEATLKLARRQQERLDNENKD